MKTLVLIFHPNLAESRGNRYLSEEIKKHPNATVHNVYEAYSDEKIDIQTEQQLVEEHDRIVLQFPFYWYSAPPLLKRWLEEVITYGWAYGTDGDTFHSKEILVAITTRVDQEEYSPEGAVKFTVSELLRPLEATSNFVGAHYLEPFALHGVEHKSDEQLAKIANEYVTYLLSSNAVLEPVR